MTYLRRRWRKAPKSGEDLSRHNRSGSEVDDTKRLLSRRMSRQTLYNTGVLKWPRLPQLSRLWLTELSSNAGLPGESPAEPPKENRRASKTLTARFAGGGRYPVRLENGQLLWLSFDQPVSLEGYRMPEVQDQPPVTHQAILAALSILETADNPIDVEKLREAWKKVGSPVKPITEYMVSRTRSRTYPTESEEDWKAHMQWLQEFPEGREDLELDDLLQGHDRAIEFVLSLLRYYRPDFDDMSSENQFALVKRSWDFVQEINNSSRRLMAFLEYGSPTAGLPTNFVKERDKDVRAAVLRRVGGKSETRIGESLGCPQKPNEKNKGGNQRVRKMADRGEDFLRKALGVNGWEERVEAMKAEAEQQCSTNPEQREEDRIIEVMARRFEDEGISEEEARRRLRETLQQE